MINQLILLVAAHALCDYPLQGDFLAKAKNRKVPIPGVPWWQALGAHAAIHSGAVYLITGSTLFCIVEFISHSITDDLKCCGKINFNTDQFIHLGFKVLYCVALWLVAP